MAAQDKEPEPYDETLPRARPELVKKADDILRWQWAGLTQPFDSASDEWLKLLEVLEAFSERLLEPWLVHTMETEDRIKMTYVQWSTGAGMDAARDAIIRQLSIRLASGQDVVFPEPLG